MTFTPSGWSIWQAVTLGEVEAADADGDGMINLHEYLAGTHPDDDSSCLGFTGLSDSGGGADGFTLIRGTNIPATPPENVHTDDVGSAGMKFYRVEVE